MLLKHCVLQEANLNKVECMASPLSLNPGVLPYLWIQVFHSWDGPLQLWQIICHNCRFVNHLMDSCHPEISTTLTCNLIQLPNQNLSSRPRAPQKFEGCLPKGQAVRSIESFNSRYAIDWPTVPFHFQDPKWRFSSLRGAQAIEDINLGWRYCKMLYDSYHIPPVTQMCCKQIWTPCIQMCSIALTALSPTVARTIQAT